MRCKDLKFGSLKFTKYEAGWGTGNPPQDDEQEKLDNGDY